MNAPALVSTNITFHSFGSTPIQVCRMKGETAMDARTDLPRIRLDSSS